MESIECGREAFPGRFLPEGAAVPLPRGRAYSIGVIISGLTTLGGSRALEEIVAAAAESAVLTVVPVGTPEPAAVAAALDGLGERGVDGVVILIEDQEMLWRGLTPAGDVPIVVVDSNPCPHYRIVDTDQAQGAALA